ncbi:MAG: PAS domain S-box protein [Methanoregula sp.]|nr:PAS domain S-box protein [Methanoregula sp.]
MLDTEQRIIQMNEPVLKLLDEKKEALMGKKKSELHHPFFYSLPNPEPVKNGQIVDEKIADTHFVLNGETLHFRVKLMPTVLEDGGHGVTYILEDITAKKSYEESLQISEARYRGIVEDQTEFITRFRPDGTLTFVNESYARYLGKTPADLLGSAHIPGIYDEDCMVLHNALESLDPDQPVSTIECRISTPNGRMCWNLWTIRALFDDDGVAREYQGMGLDITDKREAAARINDYIKNMEFFSQKLQEFINLPLDADIYHAIGAGLDEILPNTIIDINAYDPVSRTLGFRAIFGKRSREFYERTRDCNFPWDVALAYESVPEVLASGQLFPFPGRLYYASFHQIPEEECEKIERELNLGDFYSIGLFWQGNLLGNIVFILQKGEHIQKVPFIEVYARAASIALGRKKAEEALKESERSRAEEALKNSENYLLKIFNSTQSGLIVIDPETHAIFDANSTAVELFGTEKSSLVGSSCKKWFYPAENEQCPVMDLGQTLVRSECVLFNVHGEKKSIIKTVVPVQVDNRPYLLESFVDITDRKKFEEALRESEEKYRLVVENSHDAIYIYRHSRFIFVNTIVSELTGYSHEELMGMEVWNLIHPDDRAPLLASGQRRIKGENLSSFFNARVITKTGDVRQGEFFVDRINYLGQPAILGIVRDVTERMAAEEALKDSERKFRDLAEMLPQSIWECDVEGNLTYANHRSFEMYRFEPDDLKTRLTIWQMIHPDDRERVQTDFFEAREHEPGEFPQTHEYLALRKDGSTFPALVYHTPLTRDNKIVGMRGINIDISERVNAEQMLRQSEELYRTLTETVTGMIYIVDPDGTVLFTNTPGAAQFGATPGEITGKPIDALFDPDLARRHMNAIQRVIATGDPHHSEVLEKFPGSSCWIDAHLAPVRDKDGKIRAVLGISYDITDRKNTEQKLQENQARLDTILQNSPIPKYVIDADHRVLYWNKALEKFSGIRAQDVIGTTRRWQLVPDPDRPCLADLMIEKGIESVHEWYKNKIIPSRFIDGAVEVMDFLPHAGDGEDGGTWLHHTAIAIKDKKGNTLGAVETIEDVTAQHHPDKVKFNGF